MCDASSRGTAAAPGRRASWTKAPHFIFHCRDNKTHYSSTNRADGSPMPQLKRILLVEDSAQDVELTLAALEEHHLANEVVVLRDGAEALDYLFRREAYAERPPG